MEGGLGRVTLKVEERLRGGGVEIERVGGREERRRLVRV